MNITKWFSVGIAASLFLLPLSTSAQVPPPPGGEDEETCELGDECVPDGVPPVFSGPDEYILYTNNPEGSVTQVITVTATDAEDGPIIPVCDTAPTPATADTYTYAEREYSMNCRATDLSGNFATKEIYIGIVLDTDAPIITAPSDESFSADSFPFTPTLTQATATDPADGNGVSSGILSISPSQTSFTETGTFLITWTATDNAGNTATATSSVTIATEDAGDPGFSIEEDIQLPNGCEITDNASVRHIFPTATSTQHIAICALVEAVERDIISAFEVSNHPQFGLSVESINGVIHGAEEYWAMYINGGYGECGIGCLALEENDTLTFVLTSFSYEELPYSLELHVTETVDTYQNVIVPSTCTVHDTENNPHTYPESDSSAVYLAICALQTALDEEHVTDIDFSDFGFGLFLDNFNNVEKPDSAYWDFKVNDISSDWGVAAEEVELGDSLSFVLSVWDDGPVAVEPRQEVTLRVIDLFEVVAPDEDDEPTPGGGNPGGGTSNPQFSVPSALAYLSAQQGADGSIIGADLSDWIAIAFAAQDPGNAKAKLRTYLLSNPVSGTGIEDYERRAMALMALGINPYNGTATDYISPIVNAFDGTQIGQSYVHDDIFAIFPLLKAGYSVNDTIIQKAVAYIISKQNGGSWGDPDTTAAAVQALSLVQSLPSVSTSLASAKTYLHTQQQSNGGFSNVSSTGWVMQAISAFNESSASWTVASKTPTDYLASTQQADGGVTDPSTSSTALRVWATAYAIPGALGKTWDSLLMSYSKPTTGGSNPTDPVATTTAPIVPVATSTAPVATTTITIDPPAEPALPQGEVLGASTQSLTETAPTITQTQNTRVTQVTEVTPNTVDETATATVETANSELLASAETATESWNTWLALLAAFFALLIFGLV